MKRILLGVSAGIAAYKAITLANLLKKNGYEVRAVMTPSTRKFIGELSLQAVTSSPVLVELFQHDEETTMAHIDLARWADLILVAPATANFLAQLTHGFADELLNCLCLAADVPIVVVPAMNQQMWAADATQHNKQVLQSRGVTFWGPMNGELACGETGPGRMMEPEDILKQVLTFFDNPSNSTASQTNTLSGQKWLITSGPTYEDIDPVRYIGNRSSGKMGQALTQTLSHLGAEVFCIQGPVNLPLLEGVRTLSVRSAEDMFKQVQALIASHQFDGFIAAAAVADFRPKEATNKKIKKEQDTQEKMITLVQNPDILHWVGHLNNNRPKCVIGFAAETEALEGNARRKLETKKADWVCANLVSQSLAMEADDNQILLISETSTIELPKKNKTKLAQEVIQNIITTNTN